MKLKSSADFKTFSPSNLSILFYAVLFLWFFLMTLKPLTDPDVWWHLSSGRYIFQNHRIPHEDVFSLTCRGSQWINTYWLFDLILFGGYQTAGLPGIIVLHGCLLILVLINLQRTLKREQIPPLLIGIALTIFYFGNGRAGDPWSHYASLISTFFLGLLSLQSEQWQKWGWKKSAWAWPLLFMLWANLHRGFLIGLILAFIFTQGVRYPSLVQRGKRLGWWLACAGATLINPFAGKIYQMIKDDFFLSGQNISGWDNPHWKFMEIFWVTLGTLWIIFILNSIQERRVEWDRFAAFTLLSYLSIRHAFSVSLFMLFAVPYLFSRLWALIKEIRVPINLQNWERYGMGAALAALLWSSSQVRVQGAMHNTFVPVGAFDLIEETALPGPAYNDYVFGGYWTWRFGLTRPVFIDGRYPAVAGYQPLLTEINQAKFGLPKDWDRLMDRYSIQTALMKYLPGYPKPSLYELFFPRAKWALIYWDDNGLLFVRRSAQTREVIQAREFKTINPDTALPAFMEIVRKASPLQRKEILEDLLRNERIHSQSWRVKQLLKIFTDAGRA